MVAYDRGERLIEMISDEDSDIQAQGWELLGCLMPRTRWRIARRLLGPRNARWRLAAQCVLPEALATPRLQLFAARCAQWRLEQLRQAGQEPADWTWRAIEAAEQRARGMLRDRDYDRILRETEPYQQGSRGYDDDCWDQLLGSQEVDLDRIPDGLPQVMDQPAADLTWAEGMLDPETLDIVHRAETLDAHTEAEIAVAGCLMDPGETDWGEPTDSIPGPETLREWRWQRRAWMAIVIRGEDGLRLLYP